MTIAVAIHEVEVTEATAQHCMSCLSVVEESVHNLPILQTPIRLGEPGMIVHSKLTNLMPKCLSGHLICTWQDMNV